MTISTKISQKLQSLAQKYDATDPLRNYRHQFALEELEKNNTIYLDGNSLGCLPKATLPLLEQTIQHQWGNRLIQSWQEKWLSLPQKIATKIAPLIGAKPHEVYLADSTSINLFKLIYTALQLQTDRQQILADSLNFPTNQHILQGIANITGRHSIDIIKSIDDIMVSNTMIESLLNHNTALLTLSHICYQSGYQYPMPHITQMAHQAGALMLWDLSHSTGIVELDLHNLGVDFAVGCTYKYLNGGPGAPAFLYVHEKWHDQLFNQSNTPHTSPNPPQSSLSPLWGWLGSENPFDFNSTYQPANSMRSWQVGTPAILSMQAIEPGIDLTTQATIKAIRQKSIQQTEWMIELAQQYLALWDFKLHSPRASEQRGSHIALSHPHAQEIFQAITQDTFDFGYKIIGDFRSPNLIRLASAPLYNSFTEIHNAFKAIAHAANNHKSTRNNE